MISQKYKNQTSLCVLIAWSSSSSGKQSFSLKTVVLLKKAFYIIKKKTGERETFQHILAKKKVQPTTSSEWVLFSSLFFGELSLLCVLKMVILSQTFSFIININLYISNIMLEKKILWLCVCVWVCLDCTPYKVRRLFFIINIIFFR